MAALSIRGTLADSSATFVRRARPKIASKGPKTLVSTGGLCARSELRILATGMAVIGGTRACPPHPC